MIIRSFLVGTAAGVALIGVAQAADLPITKAEPVEYVKVCSEFGPGFFYIPGSDTCLKISGEYRADYGYNTASRPTVRRASPAARRRRAPSKVVSSSTSMPAPRPITGFCAPTCPSAPAPEIRASRTG